MKKYITALSATVYFLLYLLILIPGCEEEQFGYEEGYLPPYACTGDCVPVRFVAHIPNDEFLSVDIYLTGSFNHWVHGENGLRLKSDPEILEKEFNILGKQVSLKEKEAYKTFWIDLELPAGTEIDYRYTSGGIGAGGFPEQVAYRTLSIQPGLVQMDSVHQWGQSSVKTSEPVFLYGQQREFLRIKMLDYELPAESDDPLGDVFGTLESLWNEEGMRLLPGYPYIFSGVYYNHYYELRSQGIIPTDAATECRMIEEYYMPAQMRELDYATNYLSSMNIIRYNFVASAAIAFDGVYCDNLEDATWTQIKALYYETIPGEVGRFKQSEDERMAQTADYFTTNFLDSYAPDFAFREALDNGDLEAAQRLFDETVLDTSGTAVKIEQATRRLFYMPEALALKYAEAGRTGEGLDLLDRVARHTSALTLSSETLITWYERVAQVEGVERLKALESAGERGVQTDNGQIPPLAEEEGPINWFAHAAEAERAVRMERLEEAVGRKAISGTGDPIPLDGEYLNVTDGAAFDMASLEGKIVVLDFWATWCVPCIAEIPQLNAFNEQIAERDDIVFISVTLDAMYEEPEPSEHLLQILEEKEVNYPVLYDNPANAFSQHFNVNYLPTKYVLDKSGQLITEISSVEDVLEAMGGIQSR